ncbi:MAG: single-stranded DNA-binding protein [Tenericutes bacterium GWC2_34_14]|jgi:single-strand DNA-binding protein|nr:MAG: single-stranded DNA-binding protein [Tenericutes bacterium GWA2_35_7]OHE29145.1 MAG: single-stranded DNA-binding protein [Tenericutes bacterium GWC2_34_14]OHE34105.1 MAG: single-stranded DNA-binding protein [Tenericutes bacterium GWE2_34_108]OHE35435.1 MAG: single-stranded DNA-binding protein [Tenericutes bacterium GWF1_35_14]OHE38419.1 MAG: single-stranded DNA-binding protein [Tenericutes bacterium GWF2_35_184]OHE43059.1 MAG: single-stranded DNA-binding protein [Tenericutes bacterium 
MMNRVILVGRITKDPEVKVTQSNIPVVTFTLAINRQFADQSGERQADFIQCVVWRKQAENLARFVKKGALLGVEGRIQTRQYEADNGTRYVTEVVCDSVQFLESKGEQSQETPYTREESTTADNDEFYETSKQLAAEEDLPF